MKLGRRRKIPPPHTQANRAGDLPGPRIDFQSIRICDGSQRGGFEEMSFQLFASEFSGVGEIVRVEGKGGDEGFEAICRRADSMIVGLQAKFFDKLGDVQWRQIEQSIRAARMAEPRLCEYIVCAPINLNPSQRKYWERMALKFDGRGKKKTKAKFRLTYWGASYLRGLLLEPKNRSRLWYWFGCTEFSLEQFKLCNDRARADLDCRYTPQHHTPTDAERALQAFLLADEFVSEFNHHAQEFAKLSPSLSPPRSEAAPDPLLCQLRVEVISTFTALQQELIVGRRLPTLSGLDAKFQSLATCLGNLWDRAHALDLASGPAANEFVHDSPFSCLVREIGKLNQKGELFRSFLKRYEAADYRKVLVLGEAGVGKSHLLARLIEDAGKRGQPAILLLGEHFESGMDPWSQVLGKIGWRGSSGELLAALDTCAEICGKPALICIDALNEAGDRRFWQKHLLSFAQRLDEFPNVRLLTSCRSDYIEVSIPVAVGKQQEKSWHQVFHPGFGSDTFAAIVNYFDGYKVISDHFPPLLPEFANPLFLKTVCEAFANSRLPSGPLGLEKVMSKRVEVLTDKLHVEFDFPRDVVVKAVQAVADALATEPGRRGPISRIRPIVDTLYPRSHDSCSLFRQLVSNGLLVEVSSNQPDDEPECRFAFERFSEFFQAKRLLAKHSNLKSLERAWRKDGTLKRFSDRESLWLDGGLLSALWIVLAERFQVELSEVLNPRLLHDWQARMFLSSLPWRTVGSFSPRSEPLLNAAFKLCPQEAWSALLGVSSIPDHPFNAEWLHRILSRLKLSERDRDWTTSIYHLAGDGEDCSAEHILRWSFHAPLDRVPGNQALLVATTISWFFASTWRGFRRRATVAAIRVMRRHPFEVAKLVERFTDCNDPYVFERVLAVAVGVALRTFDQAGLRAIAGAVHKAMFSNKWTPTHILQRDYARTIMEAALRLDCLPSNVEVESFRPAYRSRRPRIWTEKQVKRLESNEEWRSIIVSISLQWMGGDFGIYVIQPKVTYFSNTRLTMPPPAKTPGNTFDPEIARRWILQRVHELGWRPEKFKAFDRTYSPHGRQRVDIEEVKVERFGKKYQWIALYEFLGMLSDHFHLCRSDYWYQPDQFMGAWHLHLRDFDPTLPLCESSELTNDDEENFNLRLARKQWAQNPWWVGYPNPFANARLCNRRIDWVTSCDIPDAVTAIALPPGPGFPRETLLMTGLFMWDQPAEGKLAEQDPGNLDAWLHVRAWIVNKGSKMRFVQALSKLHFFGEGVEHVVADWGWLGEYPWGPSHKSDELSERCCHHYGWLKDVKIPIVQVACDFRSGSVSTPLPSPQLLEILKANWSGDGFNFVNASDQLVAFAPLREPEAHTRCLLVDREIVRNALADHGSELVWTVLGQRCVRDTKRELTDALDEFSGVYWFERENLKGSITQRIVKKVYPR